MMSSSDMWLVARVVASLVLVVGAFLGLALYLRRRLPGEGAVSGRGLRLRGRIQAGQGAELLLVDAGGRRYLLGVSVKGVEVLDRLEIDADREAIEEAILPGEEQGPVEPVIDTDMLAQLVRLDRLRGRRGRDA